ncbi:MAG: hypothetical protein ACO25K_06145 [Candidatus Fonsibacter ubiquis]
MGDIIAGRAAATLSVSDIAFESFESEIGVVIDVILDDTNEFLKKYSEPVRLKYIGGILYRNIDSFSELENPNIALPWDRTIKDLATRNEKVKIIKNAEGIFLYQRIQATNETPLISAVTNEISQKLITKNNSSKNQSFDVDEFNKKSQTGITETNDSAKYKKYDGYGNYFKFVSNIHKLKLYEGDLLIESRFGQSIRFSAYNNNQSPKSFSPTLIIRNDESPLNKSKSVNSLVEENLNTDGSIIAMTSNGYEIPFIPGTTGDTGKSDFETKPESFLNYPSKLSGNQIFLNSGRLIFSARNGEMIFYSKKNYGFISDGGLSIDNKGGVDINVKDGVNILTNDTDVVMYTGNGKIFLGSKDLEPMVKGKQLVQLLGELLDAIGDLQFKTPSGPSAIGSENRKVFESIKGKLNNVLSNLNQTA